MVTVVRIRFTDNKSVIRDAELYFWTFLSISNMTVYRKDDFTFCIILPSAYL